MNAVSEALQIDHFDCARGSTVERTFLEAVAAGLGLDGTHRSFQKKDDLLAGLIRHVSDADPTPLLSEGETVTNAALRVILDGIKERGLAHVSLTNGAAAARVAAAEYDEDGDADVFDPLNLSDERKRELRGIVVREGQGAFRQLLLNAYDRRCAITGCDAVEALEAAHITPYKGRSTNRAANGILLRADLHRLWDHGLVAVHESTHEILVSPRLVTTDYAFYGGNRIRLPVKAGQQPSSVALEQQRTWAGL